MSDVSVASALRSCEQLVVIEAPAGCGKTFQGAQYAHEISTTIGDGRVLILAHTHAACDVFASRTRGVAGRIDIRTIDSLITQVASLYHVALGLPADTGAYARNKRDGYSELANKVASLLRASPMIGQSLARRFPIVICDEYQDSSIDQNEIIMACYRGGSLVRIFADPMQTIYGSTKKEIVDKDQQRWAKLKKLSDIFDELDEPHRWLQSSKTLGQWILAARATLRDGGRLDLRGLLPQGISIIVAENRSPRYGGYQLAKEEGKPIYDLLETKQSLLVLATRNMMVNALRSFFGRQLPIWEGHVRESLALLVKATRDQSGNALKIAEALVTFLVSVAKGFSASAYGNTFCAEIRGGCNGKRTGKPATLQALGKMLINQPNHKGVACVLHRLYELVATDASFDAVKIDYPREFWDAVRIGRFDDPDVGFAEVSRQRTYSRLSPAAKAISTIHKAKGLECDNVLILPCDAEHFSNTAAARCLFYVAISRAKHSLTLVVSHSNPSPLIML